jgi:hypothetical protein
MARFTILMLSVVAMLSVALAQNPSQSYEYEIMNAETGELVSLGAKGSFRMPQALAPLVRAPRYEQLPVRVLSTRYLEPIVRTHYIDQDIIQPKEIRQPILQQRIVEQPIVRQQTTKQPIARQVIDQTFIRPHVIEQTHISPVVRQQDIVQQRVIQQDTLQEKFKQTQKAEAPIVQAPTFKGAKGAQLYNPMNGQSNEESNNQSSNESSNESNDESHDESSNNEGNMDSDSNGEHMNKNKAKSF